MNRKILTIDMTMDLKSKFTKLKSGRPSAWEAKAQWRKENRSWLKKSAYVAFKVLQVLRTKSVSQKELAAQMGISPQQVNKIVKGQENLTLETLDKLERALEINLLANGRPESFTVLAFEALRVARKYRTGMVREDDFKKVHAIWSVGNPVEYPKPSVPDSADSFHNRYPVEGKEKWFNLHSQLS